MKTSYKKRVYNLNLNKTDKEGTAANLNLSYLANKEEVLKDRAVQLHHHDVLGSVSIKEFFRFQLTGLHHHYQLPLDLVKGRRLSHELDIICADLVDKDEHLIEVSPELFERVPIRQGDDC